LRKIGPRDPLRLLLATARFDPLTGGVETHVREVSRRFVERGFDVTVATTDLTGALPSEETLEGVHVRRLPAGPARLDLYWSPQLYRFVRRGDWDLVHVQGIHTLVPPLAMVAAAASRTPFVVTFHTGGHSSQLRHRLRTLQWLSLVPLLRRAARLVGVSRFEADLFRRLPGIGAQRVEVIPNGAEPLPVTNASPVEERDLVVSVGRLERYKGHQHLIAALPHMLRRRPAAHLRIVGSGPYEAELRRAAIEHGVAGRVEIAALAPGDRSAMADLISRASVVALMSEYEAHPIAVLEAVALGRPVVGIDAAGLGELAEDGLIRAVPSATTPESLAEILLEEIAAPQRPTVPLPTWDDCTDRLVALYRAVLDEA
jgi:glycosyltransferase involved in cell wall biosynthesis